MDKMSSKDRLQYCMATLGSVLRLAVKSMKENYGEEGLSNLRKTFYEAGIELGKDEVEQLGIDNKGARAYDRIVKEALEAFEVKYEITELSDTNYVLRIYNCPHAKNFRSPEVCDVFLELDKGIVKSLDPKLEFKLARHILRGDSYCEYVVRPEQSVP